MQFPGGLSHEADRRLSQNPNQQRKLTTLGDLRSATGFTPPVRRRTGLLPADQSFTPAVNSGAPGNPEELRPANEPLSSQQFTSPIEHRETKEPIQVREAQSFNPFLTQEAGVIGGSISYHWITRQVTVQLNHTLPSGVDVPELKFIFQGTPDTAYKSKGITPFDWEHGFPLEAGYDLQRRYQVIQALGGQEIDAYRAPLLFTAMLENFSDVHLKEDSEITFKFSQEAFAYYKQLRLHLSFGTGATLVAKPDPFYLEHGQLEFLHFFHADRGPFLPDESMKQEYLLYDEVHDEYHPVYLPLEGLHVYLPPITAREEISPEEQEKHPERKPHPLIENVKATFIHLGEELKVTRW